MFGNIKAFTSQIDVEISGKNYSPIPVAVNYFECTPSQQNLAETIRTIIKQDLANSGLFSTIQEEAFIEQVSTINSTPFFAAWKKINATILVNGKINEISHNTYTINFRIWDVVLGKSVAHKLIEFQKNSVRRVAHKIANNIYQCLTGEDGYFDSRITYVSEYVSKDDPNSYIKRIAIMDHDGENHKYLTNGQYIAISPKISPQNDKIIYSDFRKGMSKVFLRNLYSGEDVLLTSVAGNVFAPRFSNDGTKALLSIAHKGTTHIFELNIETKTLKKLTRGMSINTSPNYSPDGKNIVFNSDRSGPPKLYLMSTDGSNVRSLFINSEGIYSEPTWSPRGDRIACIKIVRGQGFRLTVINLRTQKETTVAAAQMIQGHSWSPNGHFLIYSAENPAGVEGPRSWKLYKVDIYGYLKTPIPTPYNATDPHWVKLP
jgi:TolB protein